MSSQQAVNRHKNNTALLNSDAVFTCIKEVNFVELEPTFDGVDERIVNAIFNMTDKIAKEMS